MRGLSDKLLLSFAKIGRQAAEELIDRLPAYQVALWPDGWELLPGGAVRVRDTHAMAEARRWYLLAERNQAGARGQRLMALHGVVPRAVVDLKGRRFASEQVASVALNLVAGDWLRLRRCALRAAPCEALAARALAWSGSRHSASEDARSVGGLVAEVLRACAAERLIPDARYRVDVRADDGYGLTLWRCRLRVALDPYARARVADVLGVALIPWNRAVVRDGAAVPIVSVEVLGPGVVGWAKGRSTDYPLFGAATEAGQVQSAATTQDIR
ncbi:MAG: hypothetical protein MUC77_07070 [Chromatiaceae bacterium]|nr:hypothetical protein [Chromatiaceae bacterium]